MSKLKGSLTVEASLVFPIFTLVILGFLYFMQLFVLQERIQASITEVSKFAAKYGYIYEYILKDEEEKESNKDLQGIVNGLVSGTIYKSKFTEYLGDRPPNDFCIEGGLEGINFYNSCFMKNDEYIDIVAVYKVRIPMLFFSASPFRVVQKVRTRAFVGVSCQESDGYVTSESQHEDPYVFITKTGTVYHKNQQCTYIKYKIECVSMNVIDGLRNSSGGIYYPCESCIADSKIQLQSCYITKYGDLYHKESSCNKLKRTVFKVKLSEVRGKGPCSKCGGD